MKGCVVCDSEIEDGSFYCSDECIDDRIITFHKKLQEDIIESKNYCMQKLSQTHRLLDEEFTKCKNSTIDDSLLIFEEMKKLKKEIECRDNQIIAVRSDFSDLKIDLNSKIMKLEGILLVFFLCQLISFVAHMVSFMNLPYY